LGHPVAWSSGPLGLTQIDPSRLRALLPHVLLRPVHQLQCYPIAKRSRSAVIGHFGPARQLQRFLEALGTSRFLGLPQCEPPLTEHGGPNRYFKILTSRHAQRIQ
jgi:hypothetical protein